MLFLLPKDNGASDNDSPFHPTKAEVDMATKIYKIVAKAMEISMAIGIILAGFLVSSAILTIFSNP